MPAAFSAVPVQIAVTARKAHTSRSVSRRKRERICFMEHILSKTAEYETKQAGHDHLLFCQHGKVGIFRQVGVIAAGDACGHPDQEQLCA